MSNKTYSTTDRLSSKARSGAGEQGGGGNVLNGIVILSGVLSAIFFWSFSQNVFVNVYPPVALLLGLIVGLMPAEGAFFGWKRVRATKTNLTSSQLTATSWGLTTAVFFSIFSTIALFVATVPFVPADIAAYADWLVFLSLAAPTPAQVAIIAHFAINERSTVENHERAKLQALGFDAWVKAESARMQSIIDGINIALDKQLETYGRNFGEQEAGQMLNDGGQQLLNMGQPQTAVSGNWWTVAFVNSSGQAWSYNVVGSLSEAKKAAMETYHEYGLSNIVVKDENGHVMWEVPQSVRPTQQPASQGNGAMR